MQQEKGETTLFFLFEVDDRSPAAVLPLPRSSSFLNNQRAPPTLSLGCAGWWQDLPISGSLVVADSASQEVRSEKSGLVSAG